ncbi:MAG: ATP-binding cassette domain-containing protein [Eubacteriales bacterium]
MFLYSSPRRATGLTGASGSGKTTIIKAVMGILPYGCAIEEGEILLDGLSLEESFSLESGGILADGARLYPTKPNDRI